VRTSNRDLAGVPCGSIEARGAVSRWPPESLVPKALAKQAIAW
jgi:hypothetical protein